MSQHEENYKTLMSKIKELNKSGDTPCSQIERLSTVMMSDLLNLIYRFNSIPSKIPISYFVDMDKF